MAHTIRLKNKDLIAAANALSVLASWVRPGVLALRIAQLYTALSPLVEIIEKQKHALLEEHAQFEGEGAERKMVAETIRDKQGNSVGQNIKLATPAEFVAAEAEISDAISEVTLPFLLTPAHIASVETSYVHDTSSLQIPNFAALLPIMSIEGEV